MTACRMCGCTQEDACSNGCAWVEPGLCSGCAPLPKRLAPAAVRELVIAADAWRRQCSRLEAKERGAIRLADNVIDDSVELARLTRAIDLLKFAPARGRR